MQLQEQREQKEQSCVFCKIVTGEISDYRVWENDNFIAFLDSHPITDAHTLIVPKQHTDYVFDLSDSEYVALFNVAKIIAPAIKKITKCQKVGLVIEGLGVRHVHLHLIPISEINGLDPHKAHAVSTESLEEMQKKLKTTLAV